MEKKTQRLFHIKRRSSLAPLNIQSSTKNGRKSSVIKNKDILKSSNYR